MEESMQEPSPAKKRGKGKAKGRAAKGKGKKDQKPALERGEGFTYKDVKKGKAKRFPVSYCKTDLRKRIDQAAEAAGYTSAAYVVELLEKHLP